MLKAVAASQICQIDGILVTNLADSFLLPVFPNKASHLHPAHFVYIADDDIKFGRYKDLQGSNTWQKDEKKDSKKETSRSSTHVYILGVFMFLGNKIFNILHTKVKLFEI